MSARLSAAEISAPATKPSCTEIVSHAPAEGVTPQAARNCGRTAEAENHGVISRNAAIARRASARQRPAGLFVRGGVYGILREGHGTRRAILAQERRGARD